MLASPFFNPHIITSDIYPSPLLFLDAPPPGHGPFCISRHPLQFLPFLLLGNGGGGEKVSPTFGWKGESCGPIRWPIVSLFFSLIFSHLPKGGKTGVLRGTREEGGGEERENEEKNLTSIFVCVFSPGKSHRVKYKHTGV